MIPIPSEGSVGRTDLAGLNDSDVVGEVYDRLQKLNGSQIDFEIDGDVYEVVIEDEFDKSSLVFTDATDPEIKISIGFSDEGELSVDNKGGDRIGVFSADVIGRVLEELEEFRDERARLARIMSLE